MGNRAVRRHVGEAWVAVFGIVASAAALAGCGSGASPALSTRRALAFGVFARHET